jgi:fructosamine-3-kinase
VTPRRIAGAAPRSLRDGLAAALDRPVERLDPIAGGDLNDAYAATLGPVPRDDAAARGHDRVFVKTSADAAPGAYAAEAAGLRWLAEPGALPLPEVLAVADDPGGPRFLALAWIAPGPPGPAADERLGAGLARLHRAGAPAFGGPAATLRIGPIELPNQPAPHWPAFYAERRLFPLARLARDRGALTDATPALLDALCARLDELAGPPEPPARVHGDLWGGNVMTDAAGRPWLIDPAAHGGHRELDLAMLRLFAGPSRRCFDAYEEAAPLADGAAERVALWQLAPLLLHAALFGAAYAARVEQALRRYV